MAVATRMRTITSAAAKIAPSATATANPPPPSPATAPATTSARANPTGPASSVHSRRPVTARTAWPMTSEPPTISAAEATAPSKV